APAPPPAPVEPSAQAITPVSSPGAAPPGNFPDLPSATAGPMSETIVPVTPTRRRWVELLLSGRLLGEAGPPPAPAGPEATTVVQQPTLPPPAAPASPTEPLALPGPQAGEAPAAAIEPEAKHWVPGRFWTSGEFLLWLTPRGRLSIPLVTTGPANNFPPPGSLDQSTTSILINNDQLKYGNYPGVRLTTGVWFTEGGLIGLEGSGFYAASDGFHKFLTPAIASSGVLSRPFIDARNG